MKKFIKFLGVIALIAMIGFAFVSCDGEPEEEPDPTGTIVVSNDSSMQHDITASGVTIKLFQGTKEVASFSGILTSTIEANTKTKATFTNVDVGDGYVVKVIDNASNTYPSTAFSLAKDQVKTFTYTGNAVTVVP